MFKKALVIALVALMAITTAFAQPAAESATDTSLEKIQKKGQFVLGLDDSFPPMGFRDENNEIVGFDIDVARAVCAKLGVKLVCQPIDWAAKEMELATGQIDCIWNGFTITEERQEALTMSAPYVNNAQVAVVNASSSYQTLADLAGKKIGVQAGSSAEEAIDDNADFKASIKEIVPFKENLTALMDLEAGGVDAVIMDLLVANDNINRSGKSFRVLSEGLWDEAYGIGFRKGDVALKDAVEAAMLEMVKDGTMAEIATKWFGADITVFGK